MNRDLLSEMLVQTNDVDIRGWVCSVPKGSELTILLRSEAGPPSPLPKIEGLTLFDGFAVFHSRGSRYVLPYDRVVGLQVSGTRERENTRNGLTAVRPLSSVAAFDSGSGREY